MSAPRVSAAASRFKSRIQGMIRRADDQRNRAGDIGAARDKNAGYQVRNVGGQMVSFATFGTGGSSTVGP